MMSAMNCKETRKLLDAYPDGELPPEMTGAVRAHLLQCPKCRAEWLLEKQLREDISAAAPEVPADLHERIMEAVREEQSGKTTVEIPAPRRSVRFGSRLRALVAMAAAFVLIGTVALTVALTITHRKQSVSDAQAPDSMPFFHESFSVKGNPNYNGLHPEEAPEMATAVTSGKTDDRKDGLTFTGLTLTKGQYAYRIELASDRVSYSADGLTFTGEYVWEGSTLRIGFIGEDGQIYESFWDREGNYLSGTFPWETTP